MSTAQAVNPVIPEWATNRRERRQRAQWATRYLSHSAAYHAVRTPLYITKIAGCAPVGLGRMARTTIKWASDWDSRPMRQNVIASHDAQHFVQAEKLHSDRVRFRVRTLGLSVGAVAALSFADAMWGTGVEQIGLFGSALTGLSIAGRPRGPMIEPAVVPSEVRKLSADFVKEALCAIGISSLRDPALLATPLVVRDGRGWRAEIDLPAGITAAQVIERRENLAGALGRPLGAVWPDCDTAISPGRLLLWVGDQDLAAVPQGAWPMVDVAKADIFEPFAFGENAKGDTINMCLAETNVLIGAIPGAGKTNTLSNMLHASVLDPRAELWLYEFKGTGDFDAFEPVASRFGSGPYDHVVAAALDSLRAAFAECAKRAELIKNLGNRAVDHKVTSELAGLEGLHPLIIAIDEAQELFRHTEFGKEAGKLAEKVIKLGRALGVILLVATQRPDRDSLPTGISANIGTRFCLRVEDQITNDMILGTSAYRHGIKATRFTARERGMGYLVGQHDTAQIVRVFKVTAEQSATVIKRALELRGGGVAKSLGEPNKQTPPPRVSSLLESILAVTDEDIWTADLADRLGMDAETLRAGLKAAGIQSRQMFRKGLNRKGIRIADVLEALENVR